MYISSQLSAYRAETDKRRCAAEAGISAQACWQVHPIWSQHKARIDRAVNMPAIDAARYLLPVLEDDRIAQHFLDHFVDVMRGDILVNLQCPSLLSERTISMIVLSAGPITISLVLVRQIAQKGREHISLSNGVTALRLINGADASFCLFEDSGEESISKLQSGEFGNRVMTVDNARQGLSLHVDGPPALFLRITIDDYNSQLCQRYFDSETGQLMGQAAGDKRSTRRLMLLSALRSMQSKHHADAMLAATYEPIAALRWQAMRECLATDMAAAMPRLADMAQCDDDINIRSLAQQVLAMCEAKAA